ncbi:MAG TPA: amino acid adenylation domain-containing protein, partial [Thermoanaerobaculia bacterium]|nr:amino acid adenylation domain-containing protein [Thermoanaerobaculia bacterium]
VRPPAATYPLSFGQQRLWFLFRVNPDSPAYNVAMVGWLDGELDPPLLAAALQVLAARHEALRTRFVEEAGRPAQVIEPPRPIDLPCADLSALPPAAREAEAERIAGAEARRPFDLIAPAGGGLLRRLLVRLERREHRLLVALPHIVTDGWSMAVFFRELPIVCMALREGFLPVLPPLRIQAADHAVWQREQLRGLVLDEMLGWWTEQLAGVPTELELLADRPRPRSPRGTGRLYELAVPGSLLAEVRRAGAREGATSFMTLLAVFAVLLHRYTARDDLVVGSPSAGRGHPDLENVMGFFVNTLVLRLRPAADLPFRAFLAEVRRTCLEAFARQEVPFEKLVDALGIERDPSRPPLVQVTFATQAAEEPPRSGLGGLAVRRLVETFTGTAKIDLTFGLTESPDEGAGWIEHSAELFDPATIERMAGHWLRLLEGVVADPGRWLADLPLLGEAERRQLLVHWNATSAPFPEQLAIHELVAAQAERAPGAVAVEAEQGRLTYAELTGRARQLACRLRRLGVGPEVVVAVAADRTPAMVVGLLAVLEAGGAYLPLDPSYPGERLRWMIEDSGAPLVLTSEALEAALPDGLPSRCRAVRLAEAGEAAGPLPPAAGPRHLAYVIYTSGSTGRPKGVAVEHRGLVNLVTGTAAALSVGPGDRFLQLASTGFDAAVWETWTTLALGARLVFPGREGALPGPGLARLLVEREITHAILPPSALALLPPGEYPALRVLCAGAEALPADLALRWARGRRLVNAYGPTEATVCATVEPLTEGALKGGERPSIGRPLPNVRAYAVEPGGSPAPVGVPSELWLGGAGVARGYLGRPDLTAERFVPDPFGGEPGGRLYRTGDLVRVLPDGRLDFLGRIDTQLKVRGFRVEPGEIEAALRAHPGVLEAAVVAAEGDGRLVGFVVSVAADRTDPTDPTDRSDFIAAVRAHLAGRLPEFLRPAGMAVLGALPRTPAGKVDRRELARRAREALRERPVRAFEPPRDAVEAELAALWSELLGVERVGIDDDFFALGGDSILALQLVWHAQERGFGLTPRDLFDHPTVAGLAAASRKGEEPLRPAGGERAPTAGDLPLTPLQAGMLFHSLAAPGSGVYVEQAGCRIEGALDPGAFAEAWRRVLARHPALRLSFHLAGERPVQVVHPVVDLPWREEDWRGLAPAAREERLRAFLHEDARQGFDPERPPLLRLFLAREDGEAWRVVWSWHHLLLDGWSVPLVLREVFALYGGATLPPPASGELASAPEPEDAAAAEAFWREALAGFTEPTPLDALRRGRPDPEDPENPEDPAGPEDLEERNLELSQDTTGRLAELARGCRVSLAAVAAGAWGLALARTAGRRDVVFGLVTAGRPPHLAGEAAPVGLWINSLPLRVRIEPAEPLAHWLHRLQTLQGAMTGFQRTSLADVQRWSGVARAPLFDTLFAFENYPADPALLTVAGLRVTDLEILERTNYPLSVSVVPGERLRLRLTWDRRWFDPQALARFLGRIEVLLADLGEPGMAERPLSALPGLAAEERKVILGESHGPAAPLPDLRVHELFEAWAERLPQAPAVVAEGETVSYGELDRRANRLARHLLSLGVRPEERVAVALERSPAAVVALLAVWKAGGVWVPIDPSWPPARQDLVRKESGAAVLIAKEGPEITAYGDLPVRAAGEPDQLAYVLFTSGSTGRPKGVMVPHRALANHALAWARVPGFRSGPGDRVLQLGPPAFDISLGEIAWALPYGAALHLAPPDRLLGESLGQFLEERAITHLHTVPAALGAVPPRPLPDLRVLCVGADVVPPDLARAWAAPGRSVFHAYGPTEATVIATVAALPEEITWNEERLPIGRPLANVRAFVLEDDLGLAPLGVPGELCLGGAGLARGYLDRPDLTAERFIPDPFAEAPGERLYRSGDRVRRRPDEDLEFLGRIDRQVKVRGSRVEPEEVEAVLRGHPEVAEAAVGLIPSGGLCAWLVPRPGSAPTAGDLRAFLEDRLPRFMLPSAYVLLAEMPRTPSGKPDRSALPPPAGERPETGAPFAAPRTPAEETLARVWAEVLGIERVGIQDDFFVLGGDSILSLQVIGRAAAAGLRLDPRMIFAHPTVAELAAVAARTPGSSPDIEEGDGAGPVPLTPVQRWFFSRDLPAPQHWNMPLLLRLPDAVDPLRLERAVAALVECHAALRARFPRDGKSRRQEIAPAGGPAPFAVIDLAALPEERRSDAITVGCAALQAGLDPSDLERGPLFRAVLFAGPPGEPPRLFLLAHHLIMDGVSWRVLLADLTAADTRLRRGEPARLP